MIPTKSPYTRRLHLLLCTALLLGVLCLHTPTAAQQKRTKVIEYSGSVVTPSKEPLEGVIIQLCHKNGIALVYTQVNAQGGFRLRIAEEQLPADGLLAFRRLGWSVVKIPLAEWQNGREIVLREEAINLPEVVYTAQKIEVRSDTLSYQMSAFKQKQDKVLVDVLRKMPGIEVSSSGAISYQGKPINKFYVEGMDLMGKGYTALSNNFDATAVERVEVLRNHQPISLLDGLSFSDRAAINIILKEKAKGTWQAKLDLGAGSSLEASPTLLREVRGILFHFAPWLQSFTLLKSNNIGVDADQDFLQRVQAEGQGDSGSGGPKALLSHPSISTSGIPRERYWMNDSHFGSSNWLTKTGRGNLIRVQAKLFRDQTAIQQTRHRTFLQLTPLQTLREQQDLQRQDLRGSLATTYEVNKKHVYLKADLSGYAGRKHSRGETSWWQEPQTTPQGGGVRPAEHFAWQSDAWGASQNLVLMRRIANSRQYFTLESHLDYHQTPESLRQKSHALQHTLGQQLAWKAFLKMGHNISAFNLAHQVGVTHLAEQLQIQHLGGQQLGESSESYSYHHWAPYLQSTISYDRGGWILRASLDATWLMQWLGAEQPSHVCYLDPTLYIKYKVSAEVDLTLRASQSTTPTTLYDALGVPIYTSYNSQRVGTNKVEQKQSHLISLAAEYTRPASSFFARLQASYLLHHNEPLYSFSLAPSGIYTSTATSLRDQSRSMILSGRVSKGIGWGLLSLALLPRYQMTKYALLLGSSDTPTPFQSDTGSLGLELHFNPHPIFALESMSTLGYNLIQGDTKASTAAASPAIPIPAARSYKSFTQRLSLFLMPGAWRLQWDNHLYCTSDEASPNTLFIDLSLSYDTEKYEIGLTCHNLLGKESYHCRWLTPTLDQSSLTHLRPRSLLARISFRL